MKISITSVDKVPAYVQFKSVTHIVSLLWKEEKDELRLPSSFPRENWLSVEMNDVASRHHSGAPTRGQVNYVLEWIKQLPEDAHVLIHCFAGISRSTAIALSAKVMQGMPIDEAVAWLKDHRPVACPNPIITKYADEILEAKGELHSAAEKIVSSKVIQFRPTVDSSG